MQGGNAVDDGAVEAKTRPNGGLGLRAHAGVFDTCAGRVAGKNTKEKEVENEHDDNS